MDWSDFPGYFAVGAAAAISLELLKLWELKGKLHHEKYDVLKKSWEFWCIALGFAAASGFFGWMFNAGSVPPVTPMKVGVSAIAARSLLRNIVEAVNANRPDTLGERDASPKISMRDIFR